MRKIIRLKIFLLVLLAMVVMSLDTSIANAVDSQEENFPITMCHSDYYMQNIDTVSFNDGANKTNFLHIVDGHKSNYEVESWVQAAPLSWPAISDVYVFHSEASFGYYVVYGVRNEQIWDLWLTVYHWEDGVCPVALQ